MEQNGKIQNSEVCQLKNEHLKSMTSDYLYHFGLNTDNLQERFGDVKFVCVGGSAHRMKMFAEYLREQLAGYVSVGDDLNDITGAAHRYSMYKVGPVLSVSHGIGAPSLAVMLDELFKLLYYAKCTSVTIFRIGTSGGIGVQPGTVVITDQALNGFLQPHYEQIILGKVITREAVLDKTLVSEIKAVAEKMDDIEVVTGGTMCAADFYEAQGRLDGSVCNYTADDKKQFLQKLFNAGVRNIEMESVCIAAKCHLVNIKCAIVCVALLNRLHGDQITTPPELYKKYELRPQRLVTQFIKTKLGFK
ncbi:uridine phosphorylase 2-like protein [Leptotrombidium deliense]|uniref:Uridine phosphorylase 2-like protein n=1 Tax=Leptotrombidium deliense TaxID=299467 RepID=A0A443SUR3_9ACAR|nr:uridine phosphorylase 2-like protein [Leptotrombidium deliense]